MHVNGIIHPCNDESVPEHSFGPPRYDPHTLCEKFKLFLRQLLFYSVSLLTVNLQLWFTVVYG